MKEKTRCRDELNTMLSGLDPEVRSKVNNELDLLTELVDQAAYRRGFSDGAERVTNIFCK